MLRTIIPALMLIGVGAVAQADEFTETLDAVGQAYAEGDLTAASEELSYASQLLQRMKGEAFAGLLPEPIEGWTREVDMEANAAVGMFGGGVSATGEYQGPDGRFKITMMADNPSMMSMVGMFSNPQLMASMGEVFRIQRQTFVVTESGEISGVVGGRILIQASGSAPREAIVAHLETLDFGALSNPR